MDNETTTVLDCEQATRWRVRNKRSGLWASKPYDDRSAADHSCAALNTMAYASGHAGAYEVVPVEPE